MSIKKRLTDDDPYLPADLERVTALTPQEREIARKAMIDAIRHCRKLGAEILAERAEATPNDKAA